MTDPVVTANWDRYQYCVGRGHSAYMTRAKECEGFYMGAGRQWEDADRQALREAGRPCLEFNEIKNPINAAIGYQIGNRMDIGFRPRSGAADQETASTLSKLAMQIADNNDLHYLETTVFSDGIIEQRGFFEIRMSYEDTLLGEVKIDTLDPRDVIPDPDAKTYDPDGWADVIITKWLTAYEIETLYGKSSADELDDDGSDVLMDGSGYADEYRNSFGTPDAYAEKYTIGPPGGDDDDTVGRRYRVIDRQYWEMTKADCIITVNGDIRVIESMQPEAIDAMIAEGGIRQKRRVRRVKWVVTTEDQVLHNDWSPFNHFTVVPYFPTFRRGHTRGLVDDAVDPQRLLNKSMSQLLHTINTTANSGWITTAGTLVNMTDGELADRGAETGLHLVVKKGTEPIDRPQKIQANQMPGGFDGVVNLAAGFLKSSTGVNEAMTGAQSNEVSGIAIQTRQFAAQQALAVPLDNLSRTRSLLAGRMLEMIQAFYDQPRIMRIIETDGDGEETTKEIPLNFPTADQRILNDLTIGEYDVIVTDAPAQITFENSQFLQAIELNEKGANIPWSFIIQYSNLANKKEIVDAMKNQPAPPVDPTLQARAQLMAAQAQKAQADTAKSQVDAQSRQLDQELTKANIEDIKADTVNKLVTAEYSSMQAAGVIAATPQTAGLADALLLSAGFQDQNAFPIVPQSNAPAAAPASLPHTSTNPLTPAHPAVGLDAGIETPQIEGAPAQ